MRRQRLQAVLLIVCLLAGAREAASQAFTGDARQVGMGGSGGTANIAFDMAPPARRYSTIPIPLGVIQIVSNLDAFNPDNDSFDPVFAIESASNPLHYTFGRKSSGSDDPQQRFIRDIVNGELNRDLTTYAGWQLPESVSAEGLASPAWGYTFKFAERPDGRFQGIFVGAGPYFSFGTDAAIDPRLTDLFANGTRYTRSTLQLQDTSEVQLAMSIVVGYRTKLAFADAAAEDRDGVYLAGNYRFLRGFQYIGPDARVRFDTDAAGLLAVNPVIVPFEIDGFESSSGTGRAVDVGVQVVRGAWEAGIGVNGIGNRIEWDDLTLRTWRLASLVTGGEFDEQEIPNALPSLTVELPVVTSGNVGYDAGDYAFRAVATHGFNGNSFNAGVERRLGAVAVRGGARYSRDRWDPTWGVGFGRRVALDLGFYGTHSNLQDERQYSMAVSIRIQGDEQR